ncbi:hypothetical protein ACH4S8_31680 [Streptomyces sp. NPDC021080]|uniref:hypothetical protein n=1 Tax=Streptomyces sp. NPDC021080 TaxID=3365110 RepID=UPI003799BF69
MTERHWYDDSDYESAVERSERVTRAGWTAILGVTGLLGVAAIAAVVVCLAGAVGMFYVVVVANR